MNCKILIIQTYINMVNIEYKIILDIEKNYSTTRN